MRWIDVNEALPTINGTVIVRTNENTIGAIHYSRMLGWTAMKSKRIVTHWMPLPSFPNTKTTNDA